MKKNLLNVIGRFIYRSYCNSSSEITAGIVIVGNEILKGTPDVNTPFFIEQLNEINVTIQKIAIVQDDIKDIAHEVAELSLKCTYVFTSGGIGPTHDDVTYEAIAKACNEGLCLNKNLFNHLTNYFGPEARNNPGVIKYSLLPQSASVSYVEFFHNDKVIKYPVVSVRNIYIFPGVPSILQKCFKVFKSRFAQTCQKFSKNIYVDLDEFSVINIINEAVKSFEGVKIGSYPTFSDNYYKIKLSLESTPQHKIEQVCHFLSEQLPEGSIVNIKSDIIETAKDDVYTFSKTSQKVLKSLLIVERTLEMYSLTELCMCFNGGKDCTALLHIFYACVQKLKPNEWDHIRFLYIKSDDCFNEVEKFIKTTAKLYRFNLTVIEGDLKQAITQYLKSNKYIKAVLMGTRKDDPGSDNLKTFSLTDSDWPVLLRILPILNWSYADVWHFIRKLQIPYCTLYDQGYTSIGAKSKTIQNPALLSQNKHGFNSYRPAYLLKEGCDERKGRL